MLEDTNLKLGDVVSNVLGKAARMILTAIVNGESDPARLAALAVGRVWASQAELERALTGNVTDHHRFMLAEHLRQIDTMDAAIQRVSDEIQRRFTPPDPSTDDTAPESHPNAPVLESPPDDLAREPGATADADQYATPPSWPEALTLVSSLPGVSERAAQTILAEIGCNMRQFPSAQHLASWAGVCPGNNESAGKHLSGKTRKGDPWLRKMLVEVAHAAAHTKRTYLSAQYYRLSARRRAKKAAIAVAHTILPSLASPGSLSGFRRQLFR